ncbi:MAG: 6,7-dimethyl-8-ribityllumazine synthase [Gammaproteobacteria bacterium]|nr:6,7-dimethyl-8-ribityllumazine synthase [Gammaproteobacteria bacterium]|tara:strand:+ start:31981 stop:32496 length:516 start_codon:yes stop_codon:yes gene_type:complete
MKLDNFDTSSLINENGLDFEDQHGTSIYIIKSQYNQKLVNSISCSVRRTLAELGITSDEIGIQTIPGGVFELILAIKRIINLRVTKPDIVIAIGCIIKGDTQHYEFLSSTVINAIRNISLETDTPIINGIITTETLQQAIDRVGTKMNKGKDLAETAINIKDYYRKLKDNE